MNFLKRKFNQMIRSSLITSIVLVVVGILLIVKPEEILSLISIIIGVGLVVMGIFGVVNFIKDIQDNNPMSLDLIYGALCLIVGSVLITNTKIVGSILPIVLGIWMVINSIIKAQYATILKEDNNREWQLTLIISILTLVCGILFIFNPFKGAAVLTQIIGTILVIYSVMDIINIIILKKNIHDFKKDVKKDIKKTKKAIEEIDKEVKEATYEEVEEKPKKKSTKKTTKK